MADVNKNENKSVRLEVRSRGDKGFRREGRLWTPDPVEDSFTEEAAQRLLNEPQLIVRKISGGENLSAGATGATGATGPQGPIPTGSPNIADYQPSGVRSNQPDIAPFGATGPEGPQNTTESQHPPARRK